MATPEGRKALWTNLCLLPGSRARNPCPADASRLLTRLVLFEIEEAIKDCNIRPATSPECLRHSARHRAVAGPALPQCRAAAAPASSRSRHPEKNIPKSDRFNGGDAFAVPSGEVTPRTPQSCEREPSCAKILTRRGLSSPKNLPLYTALALRFPVMSRLVPRFVSNHE